MRISWPTSLKGTFERNLSAGLIQMDPMHPGYEVFLVQWMKFSKEEYEPR